MAGLHIKDIRAGDVFTETSYGHAALYRALADAVHLDGEAGVRLPGWHVDAEPLQSENREPVHFYSADAYPAYIPDLARAGVAREGEQA